MFDKYTYKQNKYKGNNININKNIYKPLSNSENVPP